MKHPENDYIQTGYKYEKATGALDGLAYAQKLRRMLEDETPDDQPLARKLIEQGRAEARNKEARR